jgi:hypothetical protein
VALVVCLLAAVASWVADRPAHTASAKAESSAPSSVPATNADWLRSVALREPVVDGLNEAEPSAPAERAAEDVAAEPLSQIQAEVLDDVSHRRLSAEDSLDAPSQALVSATPEPTLSSGPSSCADAMQFLADVTVPDGTSFRPGERFTKTWRVRNAGTCDWAGYRVVFVEGDSMGVLDGPLPDTSAGQEVEVSFDMIAPDQPGDYRGTWQIQSPDGANLGTLTCVITVDGGGGPAGAESSQEPTPIPTPASPWKAAEERWIDVDLSRQLLTAYEGRTPVHTTLVSSGLPATPTPVGQYRIWVKFRYDDMAGADYYIEDVPYVMYFHGGYGLHGVTWHGNFGHPMSHGCVNLPTEEAEWLFNWADVGTLVNIHE